MKSQPKIEAALNTPLKAYNTVSGWASIVDSRGITIISRISGDDAALIVKAVNEHAALEAVVSLVCKTPRALMTKELRRLIDQLEAVRKEGK